MIASVGIVSLEIYDGIAKKLDEIRCIPNFHTNLIFLSKLTQTATCEETVMELRRSCTVVGLFYGRRSIEVTTF